MYKILKRTCRCVLIRYSVLPLSRCRRHRGLFKSLLRRFDRVCSAGCVKLKHIAIVCCILERNQNYRQTDGKLIKCLLLGP